MTVIFTLTLVACIFPIWTADIVREGPPRMEEFQKEKLIYFLPGNTLEFPCVASGKNMKYEWLKNGKKIQTTSASSQGTLTILTSSQSSGSYRCVAYNKFGRTFSDEIVVKQATLTVTSSVAKSYKLQEQYYVKFPCYHSSTPTGQVTWYKDSKPLTLSKTAVVDYTGHLHLTYLQKSNKGVYYCTVSNAFYSQRQGTKYILTVLGPKFSVTSKLLWSSTLTTALVGDTLYLKCIFTGTNNAIQWTVTTSSKRGNNYKTAELKLTKLTTYDAGKYKCAFGKASKTFTIKIASKPKWKNDPDSLWLDSGDTARFLCKADGNPSPRTLWYINGVSIYNWPQPTQISSRFSYTSSLITIKDVRVEDMMSIQCLCSNTYGHVLDDVYLQVNDNRKWSTTTSESTTRTQTTANENTPDTTHNSTSGSTTEPQTTSQGGKDTTTTAETGTTSQEGKDATTTAETGTQQYGLLKQEQADGSGNTALIGGVSGVLVALVVISVVIVAICWYKRKSRPPNAEPVTDSFTNKAYFQTENHDSPATYDEIPGTTKSPDITESEHVYCGIYAEASDTHDNNEDNIYTEVDKMKDIAKIQNNVDEEYVVIDNVKEQIGGVSVVQPMNNDLNNVISQTNNEGKSGEQNEDENYFLVEKEENAEPNNDDVHHKPLNSEDNYFLLEENHVEGPENDDENHDKDNETEMEQATVDVDQNYFVLENTTS